MPLFVCEVFARAEIDVLSLKIHLFDYFSCLDFKSILNFSFRKASLPRGKNRYSTNGFTSLIPLDLMFISKYRKMRDHFYITEITIGNAGLLLHGIWREAWNHVAIHSEFICCGIEVENGHFSRQRVVLVLTASSDIWNLYTIARLWAFF